MKRILYYAILGLLVAFSFRFYSSLFYPALNSDNAVTILMIHYFRLPHDLYFWGQDRMGSLIPLLGQIPFNIFNFPALLSEAIIHYVILLAGFFAFSYFIKSYFYRIVFAIVLFLPPMRLIDVTQFAFGVHYSLIAISCYLFNLSSKDSIQGNIIKYHTVMLMNILVLVGAVWVSEMAIVSVALLSGVQWIYYFKNNKSNRSVLQNPWLYYTIIGVLTGYFFIRYAKSYSPISQQYAAFSEPAVIKQTIIIFARTILDLLFFRAKEPFTSVYSHMAIVIILFIIFVLKKKAFINVTINAVALFFFLDAVVLFFVIIVSEWTVLNHVPRRYFTCTYIAFSYTLILILDNLFLQRKRRLLIKSFIIAAVLTGGLGTLYNLKYVWPRTLTPMVKVGGEFQQLGSIGIIAEYWNSYVYSVPDPCHIKATPHDKSYVRNYGLVDSVFAQPKLYVIRDMWMDAFPDTLEQFGNKLVKCGNEFRLGGCQVCNYKRIENK